MFAFGESAGGGLSGQNTGGMKGSPARRAAQSRQGQSPEQPRAAQSRPGASSSSGGAEPPCKLRKTTPAYSSTYTRLENAQLVDLLLARDEAISSWKALFEERDALCKLALDDYDDWKGRLEQICEIAKKGSGA